MISDRLLRLIARYPKGGDWSGRTGAVRFAAGLLPAKDSEAFAAGLDSLLPALEGLRDSGDARQVRTCREIWQDLDARIWPAQRQEDPMTAFFVRYRLADACEAAGEWTQAADLYTLVAEQLTEYVRADNPQVLAIARRARACRRKAEGGADDGEQDHSGDRGEAPPAEGDPCGL